MPRPFVRRRRVLVTVLLLIGAGAAYAALLLWPAPFFAYRIRKGAIVLCSDEPIPASAARVLEEALDRIALSPLYRETAKRRIYVCNRPWRWMLFANVKSHVGGLTYVPLSSNIFLRAAHFDANRLVGPSGAEVPGERTVSYFIAHELAHTMIAERLGAVRYWRLPVWKDEGYSDYLAKGRDFSFKDAARRLERGDAELDPARSGLYLRYHLCVNFLLRKKAKSVAELLERDFDPKELEAEIKNTQPKD
jgi:hypothetical protein